MDEPTTLDPLREEDGGIDAVRRRFYGGDLPGALQAGARSLAALAELETPPAVAAAVPTPSARRAAILFWMVRCARRADALDTALLHAYAGVEAARAAGDARLECRLRAQYVHVLASLGRNEAALDEGYAVLRRAVAAGDPLAEAASWLALGQVHWAMLQWDEGEQAYTRASILARQAGDDEGVGLASNGIAAMEDHRATAARSAGRDDEAREHARRSFALLEEFTRISDALGDTYNGWIGRLNQAACLFGMGENAAAGALLDAQLDRLERVGDASGSRRQLILQLLGAIHLAEDRVAEAVACQTEALAIAERLDLPLLAMDACRALVDALERAGDLHGALAQHRRFHALYVRLASERAQSHARAMAVLYETERSIEVAESERHRADRLASANRSLVEERAVLERHSREDALTGLANRRAFDRALDDLPPGTRRRRDHALAMLDVDRFKTVNDRYSHRVGDEVLRRIGRLLAERCRPQDVAARYGGEEFALILTRVDRAAAHEICERLRSALQGDAWDLLEPGLAVTVSIGVAHADEIDDIPLGSTGLLALADSRLYAAKSAGRNRVEGPPR